MKRSRAKAIGLGLALLAGPLHAADEPAAAPAGPKLLPASVRGADWVSASSGDANTVWFPVRKPAIAAPQPAIVPISANPAAEPMPAPAPTGPRLNTSESALGPLPAIPVIPDAVPATLPTSPAPPAGLPVIPRVTEEPRDWRPVPPPGEQPISAAPVVPQPVPPRHEEPRFAPVPGPMPAFAQPSQPLPPPREVPPREVPPANPVPAAPPARPAEGELPVAPPALMIPAGAVVPGKHGTFGSPPIRISRDYPPLGDLLHGWPDSRGGTAGGTGSAAVDRLSFRAEYLMWWTPAAQIPALATTSLAPASSLGVGGVLGFGFLGDPATRSLLGPGTLGGTFRNGLRLRAGYWFDDCGTCGIDGSFFFLGRQSNSSPFGSNQFPVITRPFFAPNLNQEFGETVAFPGFSAGSLRVNNSSSLWGTDVNLRHALAKTCEFRAEWFVGYRVLSLSESLSVSENVLALSNNLNDLGGMDPPGTRIAVQDRFATRNWFNGGQVGLAAERNWGRVSLDVRGSVALGNTHQELTISGSQVKLLPGAVTPTVFNGGLLAAGPNLGRFSRDRFGVVPEVSLNLGYWLTQNLKVYGGYNFLYWSSVIRPGDQIDRVVDLTFVPNPPVGVAFSGQNRPQPLLRQTDFWAQGIQFGLEGRW